MSMTAIGPTASDSRQPLKPHSIWPIYCKFGPKKLTKLHSVTLLTADGAGDTGY